VWHAATMVACRVPGLAPSGQQVDIQRGAKTAGAALRFICPGAKRLVTFGTTGFFAPRTTATIARPA
jgi:hypothetical protein